MSSGNGNDLLKIYKSLTRRRRLSLVIFFVTSVCNARCRTCFYWQELNQKGDLSWDEIRRLSETMPQFTDFWLSGGEPMLRRELTDIIHLFYVNNGIRWTNLPTNGLLPERTGEWVRRILKENPELVLDLNVAMDGLHEMQDSIRAVPGNFQKTLDTIEAVESCRRDFPNFRVNINTVVCAENFNHTLEISDFVKNARQTAQMPVEFGLAEVAAIGRVGEIVGIVEFPRVDEFVPGADLGRQRADRCQVGRRYARAAGGYGQHALAAEHVDRELEHQGAVHSAGEGHQGRSGRAKR